MIQDKTIKGFQVRSLFEYFNGLIGKPGERPVFSNFVWNNYNLLQGPYYDLINKINQRDPEVVKYEQRLNETYLKYADHNENGEVVYNEQKQPVITEKKKEFMTALEKLTKEFPNINEKVQLDQQREANAMNGDYTIKLDCITFSEFIDTCPPFVVGLTHL